ncbi:MAG: hypothetical protein Phog2KO_47000 [Phototrophicaceae bacterium]
MSEQKPKLIPLRVPWQISFLDYQFQMLASHQQEVQINFQVQWLPKTISDSDEVAWSSENIQLRFETQYEGAWILFEPDALFTISTYFDWSAIYPEYMPEPFNDNNPNPAFKLAYQRWQRDWVHRQICDNPMIYQVQNSRLVNEQGLGYWGDHYFIQLENLNLNIIALKGYWKTKQSSEWNIFNFD